jgi:UDP-N-acetylmuramoylalanine--D-glutamate ligase
MGLGRFGGGVGVTRWLAENGARLTVTDQSPAEALCASLEQIADLDVTLRLGAHDERDFREADLVIVNPAVPPTSAFLQAAQASGVPVSTEINLFVERCRARTVGVTGSVGKSTVTAMIGQVVEEATERRSDGATKGCAPRPIRKVWVGGNIGRSLLHDLAEIGGDDVVVLELSSFQLERTPLVSWSPNVAVITNITPNHLDWHGDLDAYQAAKLNLLRFQDAARDAAVVQDLPNLREAVDAPAWWYRLEGDVPVARRESDAVRWENLTLGVPGRHNRENAAAALTAAHALGIPAEVATAALGAFRALPHRLQLVAECEGVAYFDDSKSTTPEAALTALAAFDAPLLVILGGYDKGSDLRPLAENVARRAKFAACIGTTGPRLLDAVRAAGGAAELYPDLTLAVGACRERSVAGDTVLLSPACASWDQFADYRVRGEQFARLARGEAVSGG